MGRNKLRIRHTFTLLRGRESMIIHIIRLVPGFLPAKCDISSAVPCY